MPRDHEPGGNASTDLEPVDLEPADLEPADYETRFERPPRSAPARLWPALAAAAIVVGAVVALTHHGTHARPTATPAPSPQPTSNPSSNQLPDQPTATATDSAPVARLTTVAPVLQTALRTVGSGRFAAVIDDRLYVVDATKPSTTLVPLPEGHATIDDQNGPSLLVSTFAQTLVTTQPISTRTLGPHDFAIKANDPSRWWLLGDDGTVRADDDTARQPVPTGLRPVAALQDGFVALDTHSAWVVWSPSATYPIAQLGDQLLATHGRTIAFKSNCAYSGCSLHLVDLRRGVITTTGMSQIPEFAEFSPDGTRLAVGTSTGEVFIVNVTTGRIIAGTTSRTSASPSLPFTWTPAGDELLVVQDHDIEFRRASDGLRTRVVSRTDGLEQLAALP